MTKEEKKVKRSIPNLQHIILTSILLTGELLGYKFQTKIIDESYDCSHGGGRQLKLDCEYVDNGLVTRSIYVRSMGSKGFDISFGIHSPSDLESDLIQKMISGKIAEKLLELNLELSK